MITNYLASTAGAHADVALTTAIREEGMYQSDLIPRFGVVFIIQVLLEAIDFARSGGIPRVMFF